MLGVVVQDIFAFMIKLIVVLPFCYIGMYVSTVSPTF